LLGEKGRFFVLPKGEGGKEEKGLGFWSWVKEKIVAVLNLVYREKSGGRFWGEIGGGFGSQWWGRERREKKKGLVSVRV